MFKFKENVYYNIKYLPTKNSKIERTACCKKTAVFHIDEVTSKEAPVIFTKTEPAGFFFKGKVINCPVRRYHGKLYIRSFFPALVKNSAGKSTRCIESLTLANGAIANYYGSMLDVDTNKVCANKNVLTRDYLDGAMLLVDDEEYPITEKSVITKNDFEAEKEHNQSFHSELRLIVDGTLYREFASSTEHMEKVAE